MALATRPKPPAHHRKRQAGHHRQSKEYLKHYWPYLPMLGIAVLGIAINSLWTAHAAVLGSQSDFTSSSLLQATNSRRLQANEPALSLNGQLAAAAQAKANDMASHNYWAHNSPSGRTPWSFITTAGYSYQLAGENLAYGFSDAQAAVTGWMNSTEHRANMLNAQYQDVGFGVASSSNYQGKGAETIIVAEYAQPAAAVANINFTVPQPAASDSLPTEIASQPVSRIQMITSGRAAWSGLAVSALAGAALMLFVVRHGLKLRLLIFEGEHFFFTHPLLDVVIVFIFSAGFVLTRTGGIIR